MVDLILLIAIGVAFYGGFKVGNKFTTLSAAGTAAKKKLAGA